MKKIIRQKYLDRLISKINNKLIKIITGVRRSGKSTLLFDNFYNHLLSIGVPDSHIIKYNFEGIYKSDISDGKLLEKIIKSQITDDKKYFIFLDEIQNVDEFIPLLINLKNIPNTDVYVTGSNSKFLSKDVVTEFRGRGDEIRIHPLSFKELYEAKIIDNFNSYKELGGMPNLIWLSNNDDKIEYLNRLFHEIYLKDILERNSIRNKVEFEEIIKVIISTIGNYINAKTISDTFKSKDNISIKVNTLKKYLRYLQDSFILSAANRYDIKGRKIIGSLNKYYLEDVGFAKAMSQTKNDGALLENIVYNELINRGFNVFIGQLKIRYVNSKNNKHEYKQIEIDFIAQNSRTKYYIQVTQHLDEKNTEQYNREVKPLLKIKDNYKKLIIVQDQIGISKLDNGITIIGIKDFLLNEEIFGEVN